MTDNNPNKVKMPLWVFLAFSSITTRKGAWILIICSIVFSIYCVPWALYFGSHPWISTLFLIEDWSWFAMMVPVVIWYYISLRWMDNNAGWIAPE